MTAVLPTELVCKQVVEIVTDYLEGRMPLEDRTRFEQHLVYCVGCSVYVEQIRQTIAVAGAPQQAPDEETQKKFVELFRTWKDRT